MGGSPSRIRFPGREAKIQRYKANDAEGKIEAWPAESHIIDSGKRMLVKPVVEEEKDAHT